MVRIGGTRRKAEDEEDEDEDEEDEEQEEQEEQQYVFWHSETDSASGELRLVAQKCKGPRLIIHVGPHQTGTASLQTFLVEKASWLESEYGISVGLSKAQAGHEMAQLIQAEVGERTEGCSHISMKKRPNRLAEALKEVNSVLEQSAKVILSSEDFSCFRDKHWKYLFSRLNVDDSCRTAVVAHREAITWLTSWWLEMSKQTSEPLSWMSWVSDFAGKRQGDAHGDTDPQLQLLNGLEDAFPEAVEAVSYDYLQEVNCSMAAYIVCNVTLRRSGPSWTKCKSKVNRKTSVSHNESPPHAAVDVVDLARELYQAKQVLKASECVVPWAKFAKNAPVDLVPSAEAVIDVAKLLPKDCQSHFGLFVSETDDWFSRTGAQRPSSQPKLQCRVDRRKLKAPHWRVINALLPDCK
ncbi:unnamed protein product [Symbiodinium natans]|uniref:Uncharacterized protein n=1 Tax=Symbiodinium natans TaxID=878477 RepID=A0A812MCL0_9DINO|nr:unnamed protein product [Symbiodinium natans]